jgi:O-methyltransferase involved in polyketide biosynthesis
VLGGGFDTTLFKPEVVRASAKGVRLFEVDRYPTQKLKCDAVEAAGLDTTHITYVPCDFMEENWLDSLKQAGFNVNEKTYILWEGVTYYLDKSAVSATLQLFSGISPFYIKSLSYTSIYSPPPTYSLVLLFRTPTCFFY